MLQAMPPYPWQEPSWGEIARLAVTGALPHALLLTGREGLEDFAKALAHFFLCRSPLDNIACGKCKDCELFLAGSHPDYHFMGLEEKASQIKVGQVRELIAFVSKTAQREARKIVLISPAGAMNINASNALLKCLEEPAGDTVLILVQENQKALLPTIRSRCSIVKVQGPSRAQTLDWMASKKIGSPEEVLKYSQNSPLLAWQKLSDGSYKTTRSVYSLLDKHFQQCLSPLQLVAGWKSIAANDVVQIAVDWIEHKIRELAQSQPGAVRGLFKCREALLHKKALLNEGFNLNDALVLEELAIALQGCTVNNSKI